MCKLQEATLENPCKEWEKIDKAAQEFIESMRIILNAAEDDETQRMQVNYLFAAAVPSMIAFWLAPQEYPDKEKLEILDKIKAATLDTWLRLEKKQNDR